MNITSWNVNGIRAVAKKGFAESVESLAPDVLCLQESKAQDDQVKEVLEGWDYHVYANSAVRKGYSGTVILSKSEPIAVELDLGIEEHDQEGRLIAAEYDDFFLVNTYVPNSGQGLKRLDYRKTWDDALRAYLENLRKSKPVILCGDLNVAHQAIDLARPKPNYNKTAGYTQTEIDGMDALQSAGWVDSFRAKYPEEVKYSWWSYRGGAREKNIGWRLDYFMVDEALMPKVSDSLIHNEVLGSDHCPVELILEG
ncbi:exodeoxyribonuclease III [Pontibacter sp. G13]|uniref:exodeoxyribonuclease III n=1 Tax=Pontibacter sp. G13 TaxID=3074898 RepID=UPI0028895BCE|nr:exodeoxyribonuclease III [Pontibacter sp. G13]WNJ17374.1 exodeoxyribonuclease III [Pontibacter sp. G13]